MLEEFVAKKPNDAFSLYGLAMECMKVAAPQRRHAFSARSKGAIRITSPAYLMYGPTPRPRNPAPRRAKQILSNGIGRRRKKKGDQHASSEMEALLNELA